MSDEASPPSKPTPDRAALQKAARDAVFDAMKEWESKSYSRGFHEGWEACNERWLKMLNEATQQTQANALATTAEVATQASEREFGTETRATQARASDVVLTIIKERPGLRGIEIVKAAAETGPAIHERTVRTALHRMRDRLIRNLEGRWYATNAGLENSGAGQGGENDG